MDGKINELVHRHGPAVIESALDDCITNAEFPPKAVKLDRYVAVALERIAEKQAYAGSARAINDCVSRTFVASMRPLEGSATPNGRTV